MNCRPTASCAQALRMISGAPLWREHIPTARRRERTTVVPGSWWSDQRGRRGRLRPPFARREPCRACRGSRRPPFRNRKYFRTCCSSRAASGSAANAASYFVIDGLRPRFGFDHLVERIAAWALEERKRARICSRTLKRASVLVAMEDAGISSPHPCAVIGGQRRGITFGRLPDPKSGEPERASTDRR